MAGKHSDHYFRRWQAKIVTTINFFFEKNEKKRKIHTIARFGEKIDQKNILKILLPPTDTCAEKFPLMSMGGRADRQAFADRERGPPSA